MKNRERRIIYAVLFGISLTYAQPKPLTIEECIALGLKNSRSLDASLMRVQAADARSGEMSASLLPTVKVQAAYQRLSSVPAFSFSLLGNNISFPVFLNTYATRVSLQQPLFTGWKLQSAADIAEYNANAAEHDFERDKRELVYAIKAGYWNIYRAKEISRLADENVAQISAHLSDVENMFSQGVATNNEVLKVRVQLSNGKVLQTEARKNVSIAVMTLNSVIGLPLTTDISITSSLTPATREFPDVAELVDNAFGTRPDLKAMEWRVKAAEEGVSAAKGGWLPQLYLSGNYYYSRPNQRIFPAVDAFKGTWDVGVTMQFDLWNNLTTVHQTDQADAQARQVEDAYISLRDKVTLEITQSYLDFQVAKEKIQLSELSVQQASENLRVTREKFKSGMTTNSELLDAEVVLLQSNIQHTQSLVDFELAEARVEKASGQSGQ